MIADNQQTTIANLSWFGGFVDGEGCFSFHKGSGKYKRTVTPKLTIDNTETELILTCVEVLNKYKLPHYVEPRKGRGNQKDHGAVVIKGWKRCANLLPKLIPYLLVKKEQAELMLQFCVTRLNSTSKEYSEFEKELCRKIYEINGRGTVPTFDQ